MGEMVLLVMTKIGSSNPESHGH